MVVEILPYTGNKMQEAHQLKYFHIQSILVLCDWMLLHTSATSSHTSAVSSSITALALTILTATASATATATATASVSATAAAAAPPTTTTAATAAAADTATATATATATPAATTNEQGQSLHRRVSEAWGGQLRRAEDAKSRLLEDSPDVLIIGLRFL